MTSLHLSPNTERSYTYTVALGCWLMSKSLYENNYTLFYLFTESRSFCNSSQGVWFWRRTDFKAVCTWLTNLLELAFWAITQDSVFPMKINLPKQYIADVLKLEITKFKTTCLIQWVLMKEDVKENIFLKCLKDKNSNWQLLFQTASLWMAHLLFR